MAPAPDCNGAGLPDRQPVPRPFHRDPLREASVPTKTRQKTPGRPPLDHRNPGQLERIVAVTRALELQNTLEHGDFDMSRREAQHIANRFLRRLISYNGSDAALRRLKTDLMKRHRLGGIEWVNRSREEMLLSYLPSVMTADTEQNLLNLEYVRGQLADVQDASQDQIESFAFRSKLPMEIVQKALTGLADKNLKALIWTVKHLSLHAGKFPSPEMASAFHKAATVFLTKYDTKSL